MRYLSDLIKVIVEQGLEFFGRYYSEYRGEVIDNKDPEEKGRLLLKIPQIFDESLNEWSYSKGFYSGDDYGTFAIPAIGDNVWVSFENGDPRFPVWQYGGQLKKFSDGYKNKEPKVFRFKTPGGAHIKMDDDSKVITIEDYYGKTIILGENFIEIGNDGDKEFAVLGDTTSDFLKDFMGDIGTLGAIPIVGAVTGTINQSPLWTPFILKWQTKWDLIKANKVKIN